jgi:tRNA modification GTPase
MLRRVVLRSVLCNLRHLEGFKAATLQSSLNVPTAGRHRTQRHASSKARPSNRATFRLKDVVPTVDTIYALSTSPGRAAIAIIRISGPACLDIYGALCPNLPFPTPRTATLRKLYEPRNENYDEPRLKNEKETRILDSGSLVLYFPGPNTVTGEDVLEFHVHGGSAIVKSVLEAIPKCTNSRPRRRNAEYSHIRHAEAGEFTKRAFYNGRLDLTQAEALGEALAAETEQQRRLAIMGADSGLAKRYEHWGQMLLYARGELEALIDFSEDQYFDESPVEFISSVSGQVLKLSHEIKLHIQNASRGELLRNGISLALIGPPNAGKSSLLNLIVGRQAAIVSPEAGTTRDVVDVSVDIGGWLCRLGDMAGLRSRPSPNGTETGVGTIGLVEREGIRRARERAMQSDVVIAVLSAEASSDKVLSLSIEPEVQDTINECLTAGKTVLAVINKADLMPNRNETESSAIMEIIAHIHETFPALPEGRVRLISCREAEIEFSSKTDPDPGRLRSFLKALAQAFAEMTTAQMGDSADALVPGQAQAYWTASLTITHRQSAYLRQCQTHLADFLAQTQAHSGSHYTDNHEDLVGEVEPEIDIVTAAEHLRYAASCLAKITGKGEGGDVEDVLGVVFEK